MLLLTLGTKVAIRPGHEIAERFASIGPSSPPPSAAAATYAAPSGCPQAAGRRLGEGHRIIAGASDGLPQATDLFVRHTSSDVTLLHDISLSGEQLSLAACADTNAVFYASFAQGPSSSVIAFLAAC